MIGYWHGNVVCLSVCDARLISGFFGDIALYKLMFHLLSYLIHGLSKAPVACLSKQIGHSNPGVTRVTILQSIDAQRKTFRQLFVINHRQGHRPMQPISGRPQPHPIRAANTKVHSGNTPVYHIQAHSRQSIIL